MDIDSYHMVQPLGFFNLFKRRVPTPLELAATALEQCRREQLDHAEKAEYHKAVEEMLLAREHRLLSDIQRFSQSTPEQT